MMPIPSTFLITCEHGGNRLPARYAWHFRGQQRTLSSHRGFDPGALELARRLSKELEAPLYASTISRLLVELNRSVGHPQLFSEFTRGLDDVEKQRVLSRYYVPHRQQVTDWLRRQTSQTAVVHISVHSFTPHLRGETRRADIGLLYDPARSYEVRFCRHWQRQIRKQRPEFRVRRNYPYLGKADGFTTTLRKQFTDSQYLGIELEINQRWVRQGRAHWRRLQSDLIATLATTRIEFTAGDSTV